MTIALAALALGIVGAATPAPATKPATAPPAKTSATAPPPNAASTPAAGAALKMRTVRLHMFHRAFPNFHDQVDASLGKEFPIGDTDYSGTVTQFLADFDYDLKRHKAFSKSTAPANPAFHIVVKRKGVPTDTTWAFLNLPPHFSKQSLIAFIATEVSFTNHATIVSKDTLALRIREREAR